MKYVQTSNEEAALELENTLKEWWQHKAVRMGYSYEAYEVTERKDIPLKLRHNPAIVGDRAFRYTFKFKQGKTGHALHFNGYTHLERPWEVLTQLCIIAHKMGKLTEEHVGTGVTGETVTFTLDRLGTFGTFFGVSSIQYGYRIVRAMRDGYGRDVDNMVMLFGPEFVANMSTVKTES